MRGERFKATTFISIILSISLAGPVLAAQIEVMQEECGDEMNLGYGFCVGFEGLSIDGGGETIMPYGLLDSHPAAKGFYLQPLGSGMLDLSFSYGGEDYYSFTSDFYGLTDTVAVRSQKFSRNLEHRNLPGPFSTTGAPIYWSEDLNPDDEYHLDQQEHYASFKYKWHNYPANISVAVRQYTVEGEKQQLFLNENCTTSCHGISQTRSIKTRTDQLFVNSTAHVGLVDLSYHFRTTQFTDDASDPVYPFGTISGFSGTRDVHNAYPDLDSSEHLVSISTNHTGRISGLLSLGAGDRENLDSDTSETYQQLLGRFLWRPIEDVAVFLDSKQFYSQDDRPPPALRSMRLADGSPQRYGSVLNRHRLTVNYYPFEGLDLKGEYALTDIEREDNELWGLPEDTSSNEWRFTARVRPTQKMKLKAAYTDKSTDNAAYSSSPTDSRKTHVSGQWIPSTGLCLEANLENYSDENTDSGQINDRQIMGAGVTYTPPSAFSLALRVVRFTNDIKADITFADITPTPITEEDVPYSAEGTQYLVQAVWNANRKLLVTGQYSYLQAEGSYNADVAGFDDVADYSGLDAVQRESSLDVTYTLSGGWGISGRLANLTYEDRDSGQENEDIRQASAALTRRW